MNWNVTVTVQSALHIGCSERWHRDVDFVVEQNSVHLFDIDEVLDRLDHRELATVRDGKVALALGQRRRDELKLATIPVRRMTQGSNVTEDVLRFVRNGNGDLYLPGSTLKGAFRTAILRTLARQVNVSRPDQLEAAANDQRLRVPAPAGRQASKEQLDVLRTLRISDFRLSPGADANSSQLPTEFREVIVRNVSNQRHVLSVWAETVPRGIAFKGTVSFDETLFKKLAGDSSAATPISGLLRNLNATVREDTLQVLRSLEAWYDGPPNLNVYREWLEAAAGTPIPLAIIGWGTGWAAHTLGALLPNPAARLEFARRKNLGRSPGSGSDFPKTAKIASVLIGSGQIEAPLGLVSVEFSPPSGSR